MVIKNGRARKHKLMKNSCTLPGIPIVWWIGDVRRQEEVMEVTDSCFKIILYKITILGHSLTLTPAQR